MNPDFNLITRLALLELISSIFYLFDLTYYSSTEVARPSLLIFPSFSSITRVPSSLLVRNNHFDVAFLLKKIL